MPLPHLEFTPPNGLMDEAAFPATPVSEHDARRQFQGLYDQLRDHANLIADSLSSPGAGLPGRAGIQRRDDNTA